MERIIVRTISNISYAGCITSADFFQEEGIVLKLNPNTSTLCFVPKKEVKEIIHGAQVMSYEEFLETMRRRA